MRWLPALCILTFVPAYGQRTVTLGNAPEYISLATCSTTPSYTTGIRFISLFRKDKTKQVVSLKSLKRRNVLRSSGMNDTRPLVHCVASNAHNCVRNVYVILFWPYLTIQDNTVVLLPFPTCTSILFYFLRRRSQPHPSIHPPPPRRARALSLLRIMISAELEHALSNQDNFILSPPHNSSSLLLSSPLFSPSPCIFLRHLFLLRH